MQVTDLPELKSIPLLDVHVHDIDMDGALALIDSFIQERGSHHVVTLDASMCVTAMDDIELREIIKKAELVTPDSVGVLWASKRQGYQLRGRVSGVEIVERLCSLSAERNYRIFFFGAAPGVAEMAAETMRNRYPGCKIVGTRDGYFKASQDKDIICQIKDAKPDVLCAALGIPKQERWIAGHREELGVPICIGVGGTLDVLSGKVQRAPVWMQRLCLEWLYRLASNPKKIGKVMTLPRFVWLILTGKR
jgi:N-acetylglucosaminyldiphosphoundecaprenol N-acetyl-beta-D-mannosaminyltransferase